MKKIFLIIAVIITMVSCSEKKEPAKQYSEIWLFHIGEAKEEVEKTLKENHYKFQDVEGVTMTDNPTINYLNIDWDKCSFFFDNDTVKAILFTRFSPLMNMSKPLTPEQLKALQGKLTFNYGEMRENRRPSEIDIESYNYVWYGEDFSVELVTLADGYSTFLGFFSEGNNPLENMQ